jgi:seryl-tRNA synthetase
MLDPHLLSTNLDFVINGLSKRGYKLDTEVITELESRRKQVQITTQEFQQGIGICFQRMRRIQRSACRHTADFAI